METKFSLQGQSFSYYLSVCHKTKIKFHIIIPNNYSMRRKITLLAVPILGWLRDVLSKDYFPVFSSSKNIEQGSFNHQMTLISKNRRSEFKRQKRGISKNISQDNNRMLELLCV